MKKYDEIKRILTEDFGFVDLDAYKKWVANVRPTLSLTPDLIQRLSPDDVDCRDFWKVCDELFGYDPVCNVVCQPAVGSLPYPIETPMDANRMNLRLAKSLGILAFIDENAHERLKFLEIGSGYGSIKNYIETRTAYVYTGVDAAPRIPGVVQTTGQGFIPAAILDSESGRYSYVVSSNVFQHLSAKQRSRYYQDAHALLHDRGLFLFNLHVDRGKAGEYLRDDQGNAWCDHYGQFTLVPKSDLFDEISPLFDILYIFQRYDGLFGLVCCKRKR